MKIRQGIPFILLILITAIRCAPMHTNAQAKRFERLWKEKNVQDYTMKGKYISMGSTRSFETQVRRGKLVSYKVNDIPAPLNDATTVDSLLATAATPAHQKETVEVRRYDEKYGIPEFIATGRTDITDAGGIIEIADFIENPDSYRQPSATFPGNYRVEDFDGNRLLVRNNGELLLYSLKDHRSAGTGRG